MVKVSEFSIVWLPNIGPEAVCFFTKTRDDGTWEMCRWTGTPTQDLHSMYTEADNHYKIAHVG